ncbi:MAG: SGNH/GDSL hydrolase family protein [Bacteriovoracia bacterium]
MKFLLVNIFLFLSLAGAGELGSRLWTKNFGNPVDKTLAILRPDPSLGWRGRPHLKEFFFGGGLETDGEGFRIPNESSSAQKQLWTFGPSSAFGWGVENEGTYTQRAAKGLGWTARNLSQIGYSSAQGLSLVAQYPPPENSSVLFSYGINDLDRFRFFFPSFQSDAEFFAHPLSPGEIFVANLGSHFHFLRYLLRGAGNIRAMVRCPLPPTLPLRVPIPSTIENLEKFSASLSAIHATLVVIDTPYLPARIQDGLASSEKIYRAAYEASVAGACGKSHALLEKFLALEPTRIHQDVNLLNAALAQWAARSGTLIVKASHLLSEPADFVDPIHPSALGHEKIAAAITQLLQSRKSAKNVGKWKP